MAVRANVGIKFINFRGRLQFFSSQLLLWKGRGGTLPMGRSDHQRGWAVAGAAVPRPRHPLIVHQYIFNDCKMGSQTSNETDGARGYLETRGRWLDMLSHCAWGKSDERILLNKQKTTAVLFHGSSVAALL